MTTVTMFDVSSIKTFEQALHAAQQFGITLTDDVKSIDDIKRKILQVMQAGQPIAPPDFGTIASAQEEDGFNRNKLLRLYQRTAECISTLPPVFRNDLEFWFPQYETRMRNAIDELKSSQCVLLIAGEMGSGKSSLVNLLLGVPLMPTSDLQCTATIVEISYGPSPQATLHLKIDITGIQRPPTTITPDPTQSLDRFVNQIHRHVTTRVEETDDSPYKKIELKWPIEILRGGVTIVDSPGVGGTDGLPNVLSDYLSKAFGFIYVIDVTTSIYKHRLGQLLLKTIEVNDGFDHTTTLFVCNHWDKVAPVDFERVKDAIRSKLGMIVPGARTMKLYPISVTQSALDLTYGLISCDHRQLLGGISKLLPQAMQGKLRIYYRYLSSLLKREILSLRMIMDKKQEDVDNIRKQYSDVKKRLDILQQGAKQQFDRLRANVAAASATAGREVLSYLRHIRPRLTDWRRCPRQETSLQNTLKNVNAAIAERVAEDINNWDKESNFVQLAENAIVELFKTQFQLFDDQLTVIKAVLLNGNEMAKYAMMASGNDVKKKRLNTQQKLKNISKDSYLSFGAVVVSSFNLNLKDQALKDIFKDKYDKTPWEVMEKATNMYLNLINDFTITVAMDKYFNRLLKGIDQVGSMVPDMVAKDQKLLEKLNDDLQQEERKLHRLPGMTRDYSSIQEDLDMFYVQRLLVPDFTQEQLTYADHLGSGSFAKVYKGILGRENGDEEVALKVPIKALAREEVTDVLLEEFMLRDLKHANIIRYYGLCKTGACDDDLRLIFVLEYCPFTLKEKFINAENSPSNQQMKPQQQKIAIKTMVKYLRQICKGMTYLHNRSIVHRDLKPENILVNVQDEAKIADLGLANKVRDLGASCTGTPIFMAPEALLQSDKCDTKVDIYSFGMIMWEMWYGVDLATYALSEIQDRLESCGELDNSSRVQNADYQVMTAPRRIFLYLTE